MPSHNQNPYEPLNVDGSCAIATGHDCYVNISTSSKHPYWMLLGTVAEVSNSQKLESFSINLIKTLEPQLLALLTHCHEAELSIYVKFEGAAQSTYRHLSVDANCDASGNLDVMLY